MTRPIRPVRPRYDFRRVLNRRIVNRDNHLKCYPWPSDLRLSLKIMDLGRVAVPAETDGRMKSRIISTRVELNARSYGIAQAIALTKHLCMQSLQFGAK